MTDPQTLYALVAELCEAKEGSRDLDLAIHKVIGRCDPSAWIAYSGDCIQWYEVHEYGSGTASELMGDRLPHPYTTSLDAKLPGEDIDFVLRDRAGMWTATNETPVPQTARAHTEPLARRAAALLAMAEQKEQEG